MVGYSLASISGINLHCYKMKIHYHKEVATSKVHQSLPPSICTGAALRVRVPVYHTSHGTAVIQAEFQ